MHATDQTFHDAPPDFKAADRKRWHYIDQVLGRTLLPPVRGDTNRVFITVAYGYFKATGQFYDTANQADLDFVAQKLKCTQPCRWEDYRPNTRDRHRQNILDAVGFKQFSDRPETFDKLITNAARAHKNPARLFTDACKWLPEFLTEIPSYQTLKNTIATLYESHQQSQYDRIDACLTQETAALLDALLEKTPAELDQWQVHRLTVLKKFNQSTKADNIKENITAFDTLRPLFTVINPIVDQLDYTSEGLRRFAASVDRQQIFQLKRLKDPGRYLRLICFVHHQYRQLEDLLVDTFLASVKAAANEVDKKAKEDYYQYRNEQSQHTQALLTDSKTLMGVINQIQEALANPSLSDAEKVDLALNIVSKVHESNSQFDQNAQAVQSDLNQLSGQALTMKYWEALSRRLQLKCNDIVLRLDFSIEPDGEDLLKAITSFKEARGKVNDKFPVGFLTKNERSFVDLEDGLNKQLYKVLLFQHMANAIKSGLLSVTNSYKYRRLDEYLISKARWDNERIALLEKADMDIFADVDVFITREASETHRLFKQTNEHILEGNNTLVDVLGDGNIKLSQRNTLIKDVTVDESVDIDLFPQDKLIHITEAINTVNNATGFLNEFDHREHAYLKGRPDDRHFYAGIIALGAHIGTQKLAKLSVATIKGATLESTTASYFCVENVRRANDAIVRFVNRLPLSSLYGDENGMHTSSDGQKWPVAYESFNANYSFKYGGRDRVIAPYTMADERNLFPYSMVLNGAEREAHFLIDLVLKNDVVKSKMHSTDTHGYTEAVFGITHLLKISFAPAIKNVVRQQLYSFQYPSYYKKRNYPVLPEKRIDENLLRQHWDNILRMVVSIKLGEVTASQVFKRMNSYSADENPLYNAIKELGRIPKTQFILRYIDDQELRGAIRKQLNKGEAGNRLDRALAIGRYEYTQTLKEEQELAESCKRLLKNVIVCWNFMYVSQQLANAQSARQRSALLEKIRVSSLLAWEHFVLHGVFDFSDAKLKDSQNFDVSKLLDPRIVDDGGEGV